MANKTQPTDASVTEFIEAVEHPVRQADTYTVLDMMKRISGEKPVMWGESLIGFGKYQYKYASGREGEYFILGLSPRKQNLTLYIMPGYQDYGDLLAQLGKHRTGKCCLYINKLDDVDEQILYDLLERGWQDMVAGLHKGMQRT